MLLAIEPVTAANLGTLERLFAADRAANGCRCMWFVIPVKAYHANGAAGNAAAFRALSEASPEPMGLIALDEEEPVGWVAAGPRGRYARAVRTPTMKGIDQAENDRVWLVPCVFIATVARGKGLGRRLLDAAVRLAEAAGAAAVEGFPLAVSKPGGPDRQVGSESLFAACGFEVVGRPSSNRVLMRRDLRSS